MTAALDPRIARLSELSQCACRLGMAFGAATERAVGTDGWLEYFSAFDRCFFAVRVATALELRLARAARSTAAAEPPSDREDLRDREILADRDDAGDDRLERDPPDRDRDREVERASFPILIRALEGVVADAAGLPGPEPAELPTLRELLARVRADAPPATLSPPKPAPTLRARLAGSSTGAVGPERRPASNVGAVLAARRATGPPRR